MNAAHESFSDHSETSAYDIAFLTVSDISSQIGISKSKLYKDIREGKLLAEKSLDETLVVSPRALQQAYQQIDLSQLMDFDFPVPDFFNDANNTVDVAAKQELCSAQDTEPGDADVPVEMTELASVGMVADTGDVQCHTQQCNSEMQPGSQMARIIGFASVVVICSAILVIAFANI